jgi:hypothetical protein
MKKNHLNDQSDNDTTDKYFVCWNKDTPAQTLRVELADGSFFQFPHGHLGFVRSEGQVNVTRLASPSRLDLSTVGSPSSFPRTYTLARVRHSSPMQRERHYEPQDGK